MLRAWLLCLFFIFLNVYFGKLKLQTWSTETAGLWGKGCQSVGRGFRLVRQGIKMRGCLEERVPSVSTVWGINCSFPRDQVFRYPREIISGVSEYSRKSIRQEVRSLGLHLWPWSRLFPCLSPSLFISRMEGGQIISDMGNWFQFFYWLVVAGAGQG